MPFPQSFRIPPTPQTLSLRQLEPHCVNPATSIRITNKLSLKTINHRATILFDSSSPSSTRLPPPPSGPPPALVPFSQSPPPSPSPPSHSPRSRKTPPT